MMISTEGYAISQPWFFNLSYERMTLLMFASTFIIKLVSLIYLQDELRLKLSKEFTAFLSAAFLLVVVGVSFLPTSVYNNYYFVVLQLVSTLADLYVINRLCQELAKAILTPGGFVLPICLFSRALRSTRFIPTV